MELSPRAVEPFPTGSNTTHTLINGISYNLTTLRHWNYTLYSNHTLSNESQCYLIFDKYRPVLLNDSNGTWANHTTCYVPILALKERGKLGIAFATLFAVCLFFSLMCLKKHGSKYVREDRRFRLVGRRWQWYWMFFVCGCGLISTISSVDVDRDYLPTLPVILQSFFFYLMYPGTIAVVWEATRHWGSWQERQIVDADPYVLRQDDQRSSVEFYLPLVFYLFAWLEFFMTIPRPWTPIEKQRSAEQQVAIAAVAATDGRFKAGSVIMVVAYAIIIYDLKHNLKYYKQNAIKNAPWKLVLPILVLGVRVGYGIASAWTFDLSIMKVDGNSRWAYFLGYLPTVLIMLILIVAGLVEENEDKIILQQRRERGRTTDAELGIARKPKWWRKSAVDYMSPEERLRNMTRNFGGDRTRTKRDAGSEIPIPLEDMPPQSMTGGDSPPPEYNLNLASGSPAWGVSSGAAPATGLRARSRSRPGDVHDERSVRDENVDMRPGMDGYRRDSDNSGSSGVTLNVPQQKIRSMLDV